MPARSPRSAVRLRLISAVVAVAALADIGVGVAVLTDRPAAGTAPAPASVTDDSAELADARRLLEARAAAVREHDRAAFMADVLPGRGPRGTQGRLYDNLKKLPFHTFAYTLTDTSGPPPGAAEWLVRVRLRYGLRGFDAADVSRTTYVRLAKYQGRWLIAGQQTDGPGDAEIWDQGRIDVVRGGRSLVIGTGTSRERLRDLARRTDRAAEIVDEIWGRSWGRRAVVLVPSDTSQAQRLADGEGELGQIAALQTVAAGEADTPPPGTGDRVFVVPPNFFGKLTPEGRAVVLTHELTHVADRESISGNMPIWLVEGFADYVGYHAVPPAPPAEVAQELAREVRKGEVAGRLPGEEDFSATARRLPQAYEDAWLACRMIAQRHGRAKLLALYRAAGRGTGTTEQIEERALREVLGVSTEEFTAQWRAYVRETLG
ncbi:MAG: hypothetical protein GEV11_25325 [Streptosporangiales bacterium]|nr:hypothetical protein [Streptosporangiales bacterium]